MIGLGRGTGVKETQAALRQSRREMRNVGIRTIKDTVVQKVVPTANALAPSPAKGTMKGGANLRGAYLTTNARGQRRAIVALLNFGGTIRTPIFPRRAKALKFGGRYAASVKGPRTISGKHWMEMACHLHRRSFNSALDRELAAAIQAHINKGIEVPDTRTIGTESSVAARPCARQPLRSRRA